MAASMLLAGCGAAETVPVKGTVLKNGSSVGLVGNEAIVLTFQWTEQDGKVQKAAVAKIGRDGAFTVPGPKGKGLPPGDYKITIMIDNKLDAEKDAAEEDKFKDFNEAFSPEKTPLTCTISGAGPNDLVVDVGAKSVTKR